jgi:AcrR family transcriptional regulator
MTGRTHQKARTRQAIVRAAGKLLSRGHKPSLDEIAGEAQVSRATAYRYFPGLDALLSEAAVDLMVPETDSLFGPGAPGDPFERLALVDRTLDEACRQREVPLRLMLARVLERSADRTAGGPLLRQNRRVPMIEQALAPLAPRLGPERVTRLARALAMVIGTEGFIALNDVVGLDRQEACEVRGWAIDALVGAALRETYSAG